MNELKTCLYLDDTRTPIKYPNGYNPWVVVRNFKEFTEYILNNGIPDYISFDHDLAYEHIHDYVKYQAQGIPAINYNDFQEKTGYDCAKWLVDYCENNNTTLKTIGVHSMNPIGSRNIQSLINGYKKYKGQEQDAFLSPGQPEFKIEEDVYKNKINAR